jgi:hypothetical protein
VIGNAVADALLSRNVALTELPLSPSRVWTLLQ